MRKIWIVFPFQTCFLSRDLFEYVMKANEACKDVNMFVFGEILKKYNSIGLTVRNYESGSEYVFRSKERLIATVKQIEINTQEFPETPNAKINSQPTS